MGTIYQILLPLLSLFLVRVDLTDLYPLRMEVEVVKIYDGDTVLVRRGSYEWRVRLSRIDSPELKQPYLGSQKSAGLYSRRCLEKLLSQRAMLTIYKEDMYGRILGDLDQVSLKMVEEGCTTLYPYAEFRDQAEKYTYLRALKKAKAHRVGLWQYGGFLQPGKWRRLKKRSAHRR